MNLATHLTEQIAGTSDHCERAHLRCQLSRMLEESGNYEAARAAMGELWQCVGEFPVLDGLDQRTAAEVLLQVGVLTSWIGSARQLEEAQETAKNLISQSIRNFEVLRNSKKVVEAQAELACCYWRQGAFDEARIMLRDALSRLSEDDQKLKAVVLLRSAIVEKVDGRLNDALRIYAGAASLFEASNNHTLKGKFHNSFGNVLENLGRTERRRDYIDRAIIEYAAASFHFEQADHEPYCARVENNLGFLFSTLGKFREAHEHVDRARRIFVRLNDKGSVAQVDDTRAKVLLAEGRNEEAEKVVRAAVQTLEKGGEQSLFAEALTTLGIALARTGQHERARQTLQNAIDVAEQSGDLESAGQATLSIIEELSEYSASDDLGNIYLRAVKMLKKSQHPAIPARLIACSERVTSLLVERHTAVPAPGNAEEFKAPLKWNGFSFRNEVRRYERFLIERALKDAQGIVTRASQMLGFKHYQSLIILLNQRHKNLMHIRSPIFPRKRSIFRATSHASTAPARATSRKRRITILSVEDNRIVADALIETLEAEGWSVEACTDGTSALERLNSQERFDLLLFDNELPGASGLELTRQARLLPHRQQTPIVMLSASDCEAEAGEAGVNAFLRKPEDIMAVAETISRLIVAKPEKP